MEIAIALHLLASLQYGRHVARQFGRIPAESRLRPLALRTDFSDLADLAATGLLAGSAAPSRAASGSALNNCDAAWFVMSGAGVPEKLLDLSKAVSNLWESIAALLWDSMLDSDSFVPVLQRSLWESLASSLDWLVPDLFLPKSLQSFVAALASTGSTGIKGSCWTTSCRFLPHFRQKSASAMNMIPHVHCVALGCVFDFPFMVFQPLCI